MPEYTVTDMIADVMLIIKDGMEYVVPAMIIIASVAFVVRWFMHSIDLGRWVFGSRRD